VENEILTIDVLEAKIPAGTHTIESLVSLGLISGKRPVKLLGKGTLTKKFALTVHASSKGAKEAVTRAGGSVTLLKV